MKVASHPFEQQALHEHGQLAPGPKVLVRTLLAPGPKVQERLRRSKSVVNK
jgi:hypothetical protein